MADSPCGPPPGYSLEIDSKSSAVGRAGLGKIVTRCCDDLLGAAAALCTLDEISRLAPPNVALTGLFTRAEEIGFLGTLEAIRLKTLPQDACVLSLECSKAFANAPQGDGVIVRVGDASSIFDTGLTPRADSSPRNSAPTAIRHSDSSAN